MVQTICSSILACSLCILLSLTGVAKASPLLATDFTKRGPVITYDDSGNIANITDPSTGVQVLQSAGTDGSGVDFDVSAILWLAFSFAVGAPLMLAGIRFWRLTTGAGVGLAVLVCIWAAFVNTLNADGISDILLTIIVLVAFVLGFALGLFKVGRVAGMACLTLLGGMSIGVRIVLFRDNLLVPTFAVNWGIITVLGAASFIVILLQQRVAMTLSTASVGTFLVALGIDLVIQKQSGMSYGLRYLFDRNSSHVEYFSTRGWHPHLVTEIIMGVSLGLIPLCAIAQHYIFKRPFYPGTKDYIISSRFSSESQAQDIRDDETVGGTASFSEKKLGVSKHSLSTPDIVHHPAPTPSTVAHDQPPESPTTPMKEKDSLIGHAI